MFSLERFAELQHFTSLSVKPIQAGNCDVVVQRPTIFMKLDAGAQFNLHVIHTYFDLKQPQCDTYHKLKFTINQSCGPLIVTAVSPE